MKVQKFIEVRLLKKRLTSSAIDVVQYDTGVQLVFSLVDFDIPSGTTATLYVQKRSGKFVYQEESITVSGNEITIDLENQALTEYGETKYQITLENGSDTVTTFAGVLRIEKSLADANVVESKTVIRAFDEAVADHVAEFQTKAEQIVTACIATIPDDYTTMEAKVNELANAVKGNLSGAVVFADDVSPVEHNPVVKVHGKNLISYPHSNTTKTQNGLTFTDNGDGSITVKGTATAVTYYDLCNFASRFFTEGARYFNAMGNTVTFEGYTIKDCSVQQRESGNTFCHLVITAGQTMDKTFYPQVEIGTVATDYEPYIDPSTVTVKRCGKNIFDISTIDNGSGVVNNGNTLTISAHVAQTVVKLGEICKGLKVGVTTTLSFNTTAVNKQTSQTTDYIYLVEAKQSWKSGDAKIITQEMLDSSLYFYAGKNTDGSVITATISNVQVEVGTVATAYEPYNGAEYTPSSDGTVSGLTSVSPNMTILTDTEDAIVECQYNRDTNKVIEKLTNAIIALGGTV